MSKTLQQHRNSLLRLRMSVESLRNDIVFKRAGGDIVYTVDFSEVRAYMFKDPRKAGPIDVGLDPQKQTYQQSLGLNHLFLSLAEKVYLLPPYLQELSDFTRWREKGRETASRTKSKALKLDLEPKQWNILRKLGAGLPLEAHEEAELMQLVRGDLDRICHEVDALVAKYHQEANIDRLQRLLREKRLMFRYQDLFGSEPIDLPDPDEVETVFDFFPKDPKDPEDERKGFNKLLDAQALVFLRDAKQKLPNARVYLVTRDTYMRSAAEELERALPSIWNGIPERLRSVETVLFDLILQGATSEDERLGRLEETEQLLKKLEGDARSIADKVVFSDGEVVRRSERVLDEAFQLWEEHLNLWLGIAARDIPWLKSYFANEDEPEPSARGGANSPGHQKLRLMKNLGKFLFSPRYQEMAEGSEEEIWRHLLAERLRMLFLACLGQNRIDAIVEHLAQSVEPEGKGLRSVRYSVVCSLQFVSPQYAEEMRFLLSGTSGVEWMKRIRANLSMILEEATIGRTTAEGLLFMAFVLAMIGLWEEARIIAEESLKLWGHKSKAEAYYFLAVATRKSAIGSQVDSEVAYGYILKAIEEKGELQDPRYLKEQATIVLSHREAARGETQVVRTANKLDAMDEGKALALLERAHELAGNDRRLRIQILNNLVFAAIRSSDIPWSQTQERVRQLKAEFGGSKQEDSSLSEPWPIVKDTLAMVKAVGARATSTVSGIQGAIRSLEGILAQEEVQEVDRAIIRDHIEELKGWVVEIQGRRRSGRPPAS